MKSTAMYDSSSGVPAQFCCFANEVRSIRVCWKVWLRLFHIDGDSSKLQSVYQKCSQVWGHIRWSLLSMVVLEISRLIDPPVMHGRPNLVIRSVWESIDRGRAPELLAPAERRLRQFEEQAKLLKPLRNRVLAHNDEATLLGQDVADADIETIRAAVEYLACFERLVRAICSDDLAVQTHVAEAPRDYSLERQIELEVDALYAQLRRQ